MDRVSDWFESLTVFIKIRKGQVNDIFTGPFPTLHSDISPCSSHWEREGGNPAVVKGGGAGDHTWADHSWRCIGGAAGWHVEELIPSILFLWPLEGCLRCIFAAIGVQQNCSSIGKT